MTPAETEMRESILAAIKTGMGKGLRASDVVIAAMTLALNCAESCIVAAKDGKVEEVREKLAQAFERMARELRVFQPPAKQSGRSAWDAHR